MERSEEFGLILQRYGRSVRGQGLLTFSDITSLLADQVDDDHWLLDEFQDTSRLQWKVIGTLVDEIIQDTDGDRSFFYLGDTKQAIYSWRGGDPALFSKSISIIIKGWKNKSRWLHHWPPPTVLTKR
ncbi:MAG: UvrD-helicase domain-containing protein [Chthoniobacterales bacterium]